MPDGNHGPAPAADNLALWNRLKRTDPKATKPFTRSGGFRGTQIDPTWRLQMMTEAFGPVGRGWGWEQLEWTVTDGMVFICCRVWYRDPQSGEVCHTGPQWGGTEIFRSRRDGTKEPNDEAFKMSVTDAIGKCCVQIGLAADVHMGQFDDSKYREESEVYFQAKSNPDVQPDAVAKFEADVKARVAAVADLDALDELWRGGVSARLREIGVVDKAAQHRMVAYFSQKKAEILGARDKPKPAKQTAPAAAPAKTSAAPPRRGMPELRGKGRYVQDRDEFRRHLQMCLSECGTLDEVVELRNNTAVARSLQELGAVDQQRFRAVWDDIRRREAELTPEIPRSDEPPPIGEEVQQWMDRDRE